MKRIIIALVLMLSMAAPAFAVEFTFNGDLNHRFRLYTNQSGFFHGIDKGERLASYNGAANNDVITKGSSKDVMGEIKYRLWTTATSDNGGIKGVYEIEIGGIQFGQGGAVGRNTGGSFSGDGVNIETRSAYIDFALWQGRTRMGLMSTNINKFFWTETVTGVDYRIAVGPGDLTLGWYRGYEVVATDRKNDFEDLDALYARYNLKPFDGTKLGLFVVYQHSDGKGAGDGYDFDDISHYYVKGFMLDGTPADMNLYTFGVDGGWAGGNFFANWDLMYQTGDLMDKYDFYGYFGHLDLGMKMGKGKLTYTFWYSSGDKDSEDRKLKAFVATDIDINSEYSIVLFEGYTDDDYFSSSPYLQDKGLILNRLGYDYQATDKLKVGLAALYLMTAEDITYVDNNGTKRSNDKIGIEVDAYASYQLFTNTEAAIQVGYLFADDAMDFYEVEKDGSSNEDIYIISSRIRYKF
ncbi:MAG: hypothetical protein RBR43_04675 [Desulfuromonadaceae bacterium]|nr:hypothetical protein [Desulfuromonas sp.]MDY0185158.1 hypothetical protein [Desulfuromonadaceae bacterium]